MAYSYTRRDFLRTSAAGAGLVLVGCSEEDPSGTLDGGFSPFDGGPPRPDGTPGQLDATPQCDDDEPTEDNIEGPYYRTGAPERGDLVDAGVTGTVLNVTGLVLGTDCSILAGAKVDVWQADDNGAYDSAPWRLRGWQATDAGGLFVLRTIVPGHYLNGATYRPAHIHVKVSAPGHTLLTTQLYFEGDPYNEGDPWIKPPLIMSPAEVDGELQARFDFVLART